jgi:ADP-ribosylglycohydrolase
MRSLEGLSVGDAFGELWFSYYPQMSRAAPLPEGPWRWTDDTQMAISIVETLRAHGGVDQDALAASFAQRFLQDPNRGYAGGAMRLLMALASGADWREISPALFGNGSYGNGGAMRVAPIGAFFADDPERAARQARLSAMVTHYHPEGQAGAIAVAVATAFATDKNHPDGADFLRLVQTLIPAGTTREQLQVAEAIPADQHVEAVRALGTGQHVSAQDTVPYCIWVAAHHLEDYEEALWCTAKGLGDVDTTCAIVGGIVAMSVPELPADWLARREPLPEI